MPFNKLGLSDQLVQGILATGYSAPTVIQERAIPLAIAGHDIIGCAQTGTGKTAAFVLPILHHLTQNKHDLKGRHVRALVLAPTRELAQQVDEFIKMYGRFTGIQSLAVFGGVSMDNQVKRLRHGVDIIVATPGRLLDHISRRIADLSHVEFLVIDEADRMFDMGFITDVRKIISYIPGKRQTMLFSATMSKEVKKLVESIQKQPQIIEIGEQSKPVESVQQHFFSVPQTRKLDLLLHILSTKQLDCVLVFSRTKHGADRISHRLERAGVKSVALHSDRTQAQRQRALAGFKQGQFQVLVATDIAARGIDVEGISHVINFDTPAYAEDYVHRIGRTGRASALGDAYTFVSGEEKKNLKGIERFVGKRYDVKDYPGFDYSQHVAPQQEQSQRRDPRQHHGEQRQHGARRDRDRRQEPRLSGDAPQPPQHREAEPARPRRTTDVRHDGRPANRFRDNRHNNKRRDDRKKNQPDNSPQVDYPVSEQDWQKVVSEIEQHGGLTKKLRRWFKKE